MLGFHIHSGGPGFGFQDSLCSTISTEVSFSMGTGGLFQTISGIQGRGDSVELILQEGIWEMPQRIYPVREGDLLPIQPGMALLQS
jgi:hypothetical protein